MNKYNIYTLEGTIIKIEADNVTYNTEFVSFSLNEGGAIATFLLGKIIGWSDQDNVIA